MKKTNAVPNVHNVYINNKRKQNEPPPQTHSPLIPQRTFYPFTDANGNAFVTPSWGCYWFGQWLANLMFAIKQGMELIAVHKQDGQGAGALDRFPSKQDWEGTDGKQFSKDAFLGGSQVCESACC